MSNDLTDQPWAGYNGLSNAANIASFTGPLGKVVGVVLTFSLDSAVLHLRKCQLDVKWRYDEMVQEQLVELFDNAAFQTMKKSMSSINQIVDGVLIRFKRKNFLKYIAPASGELRDYINDGLLRIDKLNTEIMSISRKARIALADVPADTLTLDDDEDTYFAWFPFKLGGNATAPRVPVREPDATSLHSLTAFGSTITPIDEGTSVSNGIASDSEAHTPEAGPSGLSTEEAETLDVEHADVAGVAPPQDPARADIVPQVLYIDLSDQSDEPADAGARSVEAAPDPAAHEATVATEVEGMGDVDSL